MAIIQDQLLDAESATRYTILRPLQRGAWGFVMLARELATGAEVALKFIDRRSHGHSTPKQVKQEVTNHRSLCHPNVIEFKVMTPGRCIRFRSRPLRSGIPILPTDFEYLPAACMHCVACRRFF